MRALCLATVVLACSSQEAPQVSIRTQLLAPQGLLDRVATLGIEIIDKTDGMGCDAGRGTITGVSASTLRVATVELARGNCAGAGTFCGSLNIPSATVERLVLATGKDETGATFMRACTVATFENPTESVSLTLVRALPPATCGNKAIEVPETCDAANDAQCTSCQTKEYYLSSGSTETGTSETDLKSRVTLQWPVGMGESGRMVAAFEEESPSNREVSLRVLDDKLGNDTGLTGGLNTASFFLPSDPGVTPSKPSVGNQRNPAIAQSGGTTFVMFEDDALGQGFDIRLRTLDSTFHATQAAPLFVAGGVGDQVDPVAREGSEGKIALLYRDASSSRLLVRLLVPPGAIGAEQELGTASSKASIAALPTGWVVAWEENGDIRLRIMDANGTPQGAPITVNDMGEGVQFEPHVAALPDGRFAVAFTDASKAGDSNIFVQRFTNAGRKVAGDQAVPVHGVKASVQDGVALGALPGVNGYVVGYRDAGTIYARYLGGNAGYLLNPIDGSESPFAVSLGSGKERQDLTIAVGGNPTAIAFAWTELPGRIMLRRLPLPTR